MSFVDPHAEQDHHQRIHIEKGRQLTDAGVQTAESQEVQPGAQRPKHSGQYSGRYGRRRRFTLSGYNSSDRAENRQRNSEYDEKLADSGSGFHGALHERAGEAEHQRR